MFHYLYDTNKINTNARVTGIGEDPLNVEDMQGRLKIWNRDGFPVKAYEITKKEYEEKHGVLPYPTPDDKPFHVIEIEPFPPVPCGGTHVDNTMHTGPITIRKKTRKD